MKPFSFAHALVWALACMTLSGVFFACAPQLKKITDATQTITRTLPPVLQATYRESLATCIRVNIPDPSNPTTAQVDAAERCGEGIKSAWAPAWDALALVDDICDAAPPLCRETP